MAVAKAVNFDQAESSNEILSTFFSQTVQCERVANSLLNYIKSLRSMRDASRHVTSSMMQLCPANWTGQNRDKLADCLEDQGEVLNIAEGLIRAIFPTLKRHHMCINDIQSILLDLERKMLENNEMHREFELMKINHRLTRQQEEQIRFMLRDTDRAIDLISGEVAERLNGMDESTFTIVKDVLMKFEEVQEIISSENLEIVQIVDGLVKTLPKPGPKFSRLSQDDCNEIIKTFKVHNFQLLETQETMMENRKERASLDKVSVKERLRVGIINMAQSSHRDLESELQELSHELENQAYSTAAETTSAQESERTADDKTNSNTSPGYTTSGGETSSRISMSEVTEDTTGGTGELSIVEENETENKPKMPKAVHEYEEARQAGSQQLLYQRDPNANANVTPVSSKMTKKV
ncbi:hypothetical protein LOTGIDRAFT_236979 [Lottia gigantea]|uniref:Uncharacterized protein n=1 Tax=Lottia gigantea TaxID=225164 RepID=V3ZEI8_LOTGI|nr:hypothetical protein LOTGIDRAFT_236979 [Lottia gigantea]ESO82492.1 hypothetical protein LOTGIDRAFT_236979 [Lottia gigantea]